MVSYRLAELAVLGGFRASACCGQDDTVVQAYTGLRLQQPGCLPACNGQGMAGYQWAARLQTPAA